MGILRGGKGRLARAGLGCALGAMALAAPATAQAASITVSRTSVTVTAPGTYNVSARVTGSADEAGSLEVRQGACADPASGALLGSSQGVGPGSVDQTFSGSLSGTLVLCAYLRDGGGAVVATDQQDEDAPVLTRGPAIVADTPSEFVRGGLARLSFGYTTSIPRTTQAFLHAGTGACGATSAAEQAQSIATVLLRPATNGVNGGYGFTIPETDSARVCIYVGRSGDTAADAPVAVYSATMTGARAPSIGPLSLRSSRSPGVDDLDVFITASGFAEVPRQLTITALGGGGSCSATAAEERARRGVSVLLSDYTTGGGSYSEPVAFRPPSSGNWLLCAYLGPSGTAPEARGQLVLPVTEPWGTLALRLASRGAVGRPSTVEMSGSVESQRRLFVYAGPERGCAATATGESGRAGIAPVPGANADLVGPGGFSRPTSVSGPGSATIRLCGYLAEFADKAPLATATLAFAPGTGSTPPGGTPPGGGDDPGTPPAAPLPPSVGKQAVGGFYVNNTVMPPGVTAARFVELAKRSGERWGYKFRGVTSKGAAKRDGIRVVGFSRSISEQRLAGIVVFQKRVRPKGCKTRASRRLKRCALRTVPAERDVALSRDLDIWWQWPEHPPADRMDLESVLLRTFGVLAGNKADKPACSGSPLLRSTGVTPGWWWRDVGDTFRPRCPVS